MWDITWIKNLTLLDKMSILTESYYKDLAILMTELKPHLVTLGDSLQHTATSYVQGLASPRTHGTYGSPTSEAGILFGVKRCSKD